QKMTRKYIRLLIPLLLAVALLVIVSCKPNRNKPQAVEPTSSPTMAPGNQASAGEPTITPDPQASDGQPIVTPDPQAAANQPTSTPAAPTQAPFVPTPMPVDYAEVKPNEIGEIPIVMFHNFVENLADTTDPDYTTS